MNAMKNDSVNNEKIPVYVATTLAFLRCCSRPYFSLGFAGSPGAT